MLGDISASLTHLVIKKPKLLFEPHKLILSDIFLISCFRKISQTASIQPINFMKYLSIFLLLFCLACKDVPQKDAPQKEERPNVILIMADDMGYECLSANGSTVYSTPILDSLSANGIRFTRGYLPAPLHSFPCQNHDRQI